MNLTERAEVRRETFYKLTNSADVPKAPSGNRNLAQGTSKDWSKPFTGFSGAENIGISLYKVLTDGLSVGDTFKTRIVLKYTNIVPASGKTAIIRMQGSGNVTNWGSGGYNFSTWKTISGSGEVVIEHEFKITADHLKNDYWNLGFRHDWIASGSLQWKLAKAERNTVFSDWSAAPEDLGWSTDTLVPTQTQRYLWKFDYIYYSDDSVEIAGPVNLSIAGEDGIAGKDGVGLKSTVVTYGLSASETTKPITWYDQVPTLTKGQYLWTKTVWTYTDNTTETGYQKTYIARDGNDGNDGIPGKDGVGIKTTTITYAGSTSGTITPTSGWTSAIPSVPAGQYLWTKTVWTYTDETSEIGYSVAKMGEDGVIESNGENRIFYGRGDTKKGFFKKATIGTDWNGVPYGEFDHSQWHVTGTTQRWDSVTTTAGLKLLGNSTTIPTGKWTMTQDIYLTDSVEGCGGYNYVRAERLPDEGFHDITYVSIPIISNKCRRAIWNPEPDRQSYGGNPLINPLEVNNHNNSPVKITTKCVPDELGNGVTQYIFEATSSNPTGSLNIPSVRNAIPQDANKTWTATLKIRANKTCKLSHLGFERFSVMHDVTIKPEWQTLYFNGKADGTYGAFVLYGLDPQALSSKVVIEIAEVKICDENVSKEEMSKTLLTRYWYRKSNTREFTEANRIGLNGSVNGGVQISIPAGKKTDAKVRLRNVSLRHGDVEIPFAPAPEDIYDQNDSKVDQDQLDQIANELRDRQDRLAQELAAKALASEVSELTTQLKNLKESDLAGKADITNAVASLEKRLANVIPLGNMAQKLEFIDSYILQGEEGMEIGNKNSGSKVMITPDRIGFFSGGTEVASFSSGQLRINNGFFADTITVGHFMTRRHPNNQYVNGTYFVK